MPAPACQSSYVDLGNVHRLKSQKQKAPSYAQADASRAGNRELRTFLLQKETLGAWLHQFSSVLVLTKSRPEDSSEVLWSVTWLHYGFSSLASECDPEAPRLQRTENTAEDT